MRKDYYNLVHDLKEDIAKDIKTIVKENGGKIAFPNPTSEETIEEKVYVQAHVDSSGNTEPCVVDSIEIVEPSVYVYVNLWQDFVQGTWRVELTELGIEALLEIYEHIAEE